MSDDQTGTIDETTSADGAAEATLNADPAVDQDHAGGAEQATQSSEEPGNASSSTTTQSTEDTEAELDKRALAEPPPPANPVLPGLPPEIAPLLKDPAALAEKVKHWQNLEKLHGRQAAELGQVRKEREKWQGIDPEQAKAALAAQERAAKQANLQPWNRDHPKHGKFVAVREGIRRDLKRLERVPPDQREATKAALLQDYTQEERDQFDAYERWRQDEESLAPEDREDRYREMARNEALEAVRGYVQAQEHHRAAAEFVTQHRDLLQQHPNDAARILDPNTSRREIAVEFAALKAQLAEATKGRAQDLRVVESAKARDQQSRQAATISRDVGTKRKPNAVDEALKRARENGEDVFDSLVQQYEET